MQDLEMLFADTLAMRMKELEETELVQIFIQLFVGFLIFNAKESR